MRGDSEWSEVLEKLSTNREASYITWWASIHNPILSSLAASLWSITPKVVEENWNTTQKLLHKECHSDS